MSLLDGPLAELVGPSGSNSSSSKQGAHSTLQVGHVWCDLVLG
jgi:hypothetical protein